MKAKWRRFFLVAAMLLLASGGCRFAARLPAVLKGVSATSAASKTPHASITATGEADAAHATQPAPLETAAPTPERAMILADHSIEESSEKPRYEIHARYPSLQWDDPRASAFNETAEKITLREIRAFKENVYRIPNDPPFATLGSSLEIDYAPTISQAGVLSVLFQISFYSAGAAHPGNYSMALNYDLEKGRTIQLGDLFEDGAPYLRALSKACIQDLKDRGRLEWEKGALPEIENYQVWNITPEGLLITFDEYQVASYATGPQSVTVPYENLSPMLRKDGPLHGLLGR